MKQKLQLYRGDGTTTRQMREAEKYALYLWCNDKLLYPKNLAKHLGRHDLRVEGLSFLDGVSRGRLFSEIVVDHATVLSREQFERVLSLGRL